jgi:hypothetical protein
MKMFSFSAVRRLAHIQFLLCIALLAGCATITFKPGAQPNAMADDESACHAANQSNAGYVECMRSRGWFVTGAATSGDKEATKAPAPAATPNAAIKDHATPPTPAAAIAPAPTPSPTVSDAAVTPGSAAAVPPSPREPVDLVEPTTAEPEGETDPLALVEVGSWWKFGGSVGDLDRATAQCVAELGPAHKPAAGSKEVTVGLRNCLRADGWRGAP